jgi:hypothetical protein
MPNDDLYRRPASQNRRQALFPAFRRKADSFSSIREIVKQPKTRVMEVTCIRFMERTVLKSG